MLAIYVNVKDVAALQVAALLDTDWKVLYCDRLPLAHIKSLSLFYLSIAGKPNSCICLLHVQQLILTNNGKPITQALQSR